MGVYKRADLAEESLKYRIRDAGEALQNAVAMLLSGSSRGENIEKYTVQIRKAQSSLYYMGYLRDNTSPRFGLKDHDLKTAENVLSAYLDEILNPIL